MSRIAVVGTGYVGLTTGAYLAHLGHQVTCADVVQEKVERLNRGEIPIVEDGLGELVREGVEGGRLTFVLGARTAAADAEFVFLCLPTPQGADGAADMSYIQEAATDIGPVLQPETVVINKSTVPVGSTRVVQHALGRGDVFVVSNPEFLREGSAVHDCLHPDRIVIGADDQAAAGRVAALFEDIQAPLIVTDPASAEMIKYASNAFLATKVSFVNAVANLCEAVGADVREVSMGMGYDKRIGFEFLKPGPGWGGSCFVGDETLLIRVDDDIELLTFEELWRWYEDRPVVGLEVLSWRNGEPAPEFLPVERLTRRPYDGDVVTVRTKMGRRVTVTADHPFVTCDGVDAEDTELVLAGDLSTSHWLPIARRFPLVEPSAPGSIDFEDVRRAGRIPNTAWRLDPAYKQALLRGLWDGDGSWSYVDGGPSIVFEYGTASRTLADGMVRLLGDLGITARLKVGRTKKSTVDNYWLVISGAAQLEEAIWLFPEDEQETILRSINGQTRWTLPTGYRRLSKNASWVRVTSAERRHFEGDVYSLEVPLAHTVVTSNGLVAHNCFPKDSRALVKIAEDNGYDFGLLRGVIQVNDEQYERVATKIAEAAGGSIDGKTVGVWGLTFKARTDDRRDSPAIEVIRRLQERGAATIRAFDPTVPAGVVAKDLDGIEICADPYAAVEGAQVLALLTEWDEFRWLDFEKVAAAMVQPTIVDARNLLDPAALKRRGFTYEGVGR